MPFGTSLLSRKSSVIILVVSSAILVSVSIAVTYQDALDDAFFPLSRKRSTNWTMRTDPNVKVRGIIDEFKLNYRIDGDFSFHRFPAFIVLNSTETLWTNESAWENWTRPQIGYDYIEVSQHNFSVGMTVEVNGYWLPIIDHNPYIGMIVVGPLIYGSYVKPLES